MMRKNLPIILFFLCIVSGVHSQDIQYARKLIDTLCSPGMYGRGYVNDGMAQAAYYLSAEMQKAGLKEASEDYLQAFPIGVNTFPGEVSLRLKDTALLAGLHFSVAPFSPPMAGRYALVYPDSLELALQGSRWKAPDSNSLIVFPDYSRESPLRMLADSLRFGNPFGCAGIVLQKEKISWYVSRSFPVRDYTVIEVLDSLWNGQPDSLELVIRSVEEPHFQVENVFGFVEGRVRPEEFILFTAHYDHLGMMGNHAMFPGAHDNASGTALIMDLARHFAQSPADYSVGFLACAAEESGLHGSTFFADHPLIPLERIRMVVNLDLVGSGSEGIHIVNGKIHPEAVALMEEINERDALLAGITAGGTSANSDHYPFYAKGVPAIFIFTRGKEYREYHTLADRAKDLPLTAYEALFRMLTTFSDAWMEDGK